MVQRQKKDQSQAVVSAKLHYTTVIILGLGNIATFALAVLLTSSLLGNGLGYFAALKEQATVHRVSQAMTSTNCQTMAVFATDVTSGPVGGYLTVLGNGFGTSGSVKLNGTAAISFWSATGNPAAPSRVIVKIPATTAGSLVLTRAFDGCAVTAISSFLITTGTVHVVDKDGVGGVTCADSGSGVASAPWCTLNWASTHVAAGDQIIIRAGTYNEDYTNNCSSTSAIAWKVSVAGTADLPIVWRSYPGETVTVRPGASCCPAGTTPCTYDNSTKSGTCRDLETVSIAADNNVFSGIKFQEGWDDTVQLQAPGNDTIFDNEITLTHRLWDGSNQSAQHPAAGAPLCYPPVGSGIGTSSTHSLGNRVIGNRIHDNGSNLWKDHGTYDTIHEVAYNDVYNNYAYGLQYKSGGDFVDQLIHHNWIHNNSVGDANSGGIILQHGTNYYVWDNVIYQNNGNGIAARYGTLTGGIVLFNNTLRGNARDNVALDNVSGPVVFKNNIVDTTGGSSTALNVAVGVGTVTSANNYYSAGASIYCNGHAGCDGSVGFGDPYFNNIAALPPDFHLLDISQCRDAGTNDPLGQGVNTCVVSGVSCATDLDRQSRTSGAWDIGADEFVAPPSSGGGGGRFRTIKVNE